MRWINRSFFRSVKFRVATVYASLLTVSFLVVFGVVFAYSQLELYTLMDRELSGTVERLAFEYMTGQPLPSEYGTVESKKAMRAARGTKQKIRDFDTMLVFENMQNGHTLLLGKMHGQLKIIEMGPLGRSYKVADRKTPEKPELNIAEFTRKMPVGGRQFDYYWTCRKDGENIFGSGISASDQKWVKLLTYKPGAGVKFDVVNTGRHRVRVAYRVLDDRQVIAAGRSLHDFDSGIERLLIVFAAVAGSVLFLSFICSYLIAWRLCRGVEAVSIAADAVANGDYSRRVMPHNSGSEIDQMMKNFNTMIGNTEKLMEELRTISDNIAHDLRTPLTRMLGRAELAVTGNMDKQSYEDAFAANVEECRRMLTLINTMLDITKTEAGTNKLRLEKFDLVQLLEQAIELFTMLAEQKKIQIRCRVPEMPVQINGDRMKLQQLIANLLDNAIKFTAAGGLVEVNLQLERNTAVLTLRDTGCGMSEEEVAQVFKRFYRADSSRSLPGNGLGMSLVQAIVNAHNGSIEISSQIGEGTYVWVGLPLEHNTAE